MVQFVAKMTTAEKLKTDQRAAANVKTLRGCIPVREFSKRRKDSAGRACRPASQGSNEEGAAAMSVTSLRGTSLCTAHRTGCRSTPKPTTAI
jgi:hypothetical protein